MQTTFHNERVAAIADRYRQRGYQVVEEPDADQLPDFLREFDFSPDLLAKNETESVVVEVQSYGQVARSRKLEQLAKSIESNSGWRLELVLSNPPESLVPEAKQRTIGFPEIEGRITSSQHLALMGDLLAAVILIWSALEATLRIGLERIPASFINNASTAIIKQGVAYGLMDPKDYDTLNKMLPVRNAAAHGFAAAVDPNLLDNVTNITKRILEEVKGLK